MAHINHHIPNERERLELLLLHTVVEHSDELPTVEQNEYYYPLLHRYKRYKAYMEQRGRPVRTEVYAE